MSVMTATSPSQVCFSSFPLQPIPIVGMSRAAFCNEMKALGIGTQVHYIPTHILPFYVGRQGTQTLHGAESYYDKVVSLPFYPDLSNDDIKRVVETIRKILT